MDMTRYVPDPVGRARPPTAGPRPGVRGDVGTRGAAVKKNGGLFVNGMDRSE